MDQRNNAAAPYMDRADAGRRLGESLGSIVEPKDDLVVLGLPRGGVPVAFEVAQRLEKPLDIYVVRKLGVPGYPELAMGAIASGGAVVINDRVLQDLALSHDDVEAVVARERRELELQESRLRDGKPAEPIAGRTVMVVDDGMATGASMRVAVRGLKEQGARKVIVAVPVAPSHSCDVLGREVEAVVCALTPPRFRAVGEWYRDFTQVSDEQVRSLLSAARRHH